MTELPSLQDQEDPLHEQLAVALIEAIPSHWRSGVLEVRHGVSPGGMKGLLHAIRSPEGHPELVAPTMPMFEASLALSDLYAGRPRQWTAITLTVHWQDEKGTWAMEAEYAY